MLLVRRKVLYSVPYHKARALKKSVVKITEQGQKLAGGGAGWGALLILISGFLRISYLSIPHILLEEIHSCYKHLIINPSVLPTPESRPEGRNPIMSWQGKTTIKHPLLPTDSRIAYVDSRFLPP